MTTNIRVKQAAHYVGLSKSSLDKMRCLGTGPVYFKLGKSVIYSTAALDDWMAARTRTSTWGDNDNSPGAATKVA